MEPVRYPQGRNMNRSMNMSPNMQRDSVKRPDFHVDSDDFPIGMGYVPMQKWRSLYPLEQGFCEGTIFMELNQKFCGKRGNRA